MRILFSTCARKRENVSCCAARCGRKSKTEGARRPRRGSHVFQCSLCASGSFNSGSSRQTVEKKKAAPIDPFPRPWRARSPPNSTRFPRVCLEPFILQSPARRRRGIRAKGVARERRERQKKKKRTKLKGKEKAKKETHADFAFDASRLPRPPQTPPSNPSASRARPAHSIEFARSLRRKKKKKEQLTGTRPWTGAP